MEILRELVFEVWLNEKYLKEDFEKAIQDSIGKHFAKIKIAPYNVNEVAISIKEEILKSKPKQIENIIDHYSSLGFDISVDFDEKDKITKCHVDGKTLKSLEILCHKPNFQFKEGLREEYIQHLVNSFFNSLAKFAKGVPNMFFDLISKHPSFLEYTKKNLPEMDLK